MGSCAHGHSIIINIIMKIIIIIIMIIIIIHGTWGQLGANLGPTWAKLKQLGASGEAPNIKTLAWDNPQIFKNQAPNFRKLIMRSNGTRDIYIYIYIYRDI